jgi:hypothetical protein
VTWLTQFGWQLVLGRPEPGGGHGTEIKTSEVRICRRDGVDHPLGCDMGDGSAELGHRSTGRSFCFCTKSTDMRERMLLFCLLGLVLTATIILVTAPGAVTWALALIE